MTTEDDFDVGADANGTVYLNCPIDGCSEFMYMLKRVSLSHLRREASEHLAEMHTFHAERGL